MDPSTRETMFSSGNQEWRTPPWLFQYLEKLLNRKFVLDAAATPENTLCDAFYTKKENGLKQDWITEVRRLETELGIDPGKGAVFVNPPFSATTSKLWAAKGYETGIGRGNGLLDFGVVVAMVLPARIDTEFFHRYIANAQCRWFAVEGRLRFSEAENVAPFPSLIAVWGLYPTTHHCDHDWIRHGVIQQPDSVFKGRRPSTAWRRGI